MLAVVVFGATGRTGKQVVEQALAAGHEVTAIVRRPSAVAIEHRCLTVVRGDVLEPASFAALFAGKHIVISAIGAAGKGAADLYPQGAANILHAMAGAGIRRFICVSASGLSPGPRLQRWFAKPLLWAAFRETYTGLTRMEQIVKASALDWTILRAPMLTNGRRTGKYMVAINRHLSRSFKISRADLAEYIVSQIDSQATARSVVEITS